MPDRSKENPTHLTSTKALLSHFHNFFSGTLVVNIGDVVMAWTKETFRATLHRVKNSPSKHRISGPFFFQPRLDCEIEPIDDDAFAESGANLPLNKPFAFGEYVLNKFHKSYGIS